MGDEMNSEDDLASRALAAAVTARQEMEDQERRLVEKELESQRRETAMAGTLGHPAVQAVTRTLAVRGTPADVREFIVAGRHCHSLPPEHKAEVLCAAPSQLAV